MKAFSIGVKRTLSKKELEELRKKQDEEAAAQVFEEFVATFQDGPSKSSKVWVKAGTFNAGTRGETPCYDRPNLTCLKADGTCCKNWLMLVT